MKYLLVRSAVLEKEDVGLEEKGKERKCVGFILYLLYILIYLSSINILGYYTTIYSIPSHPFLSRYPLIFYHMKISIYRRIAEKHTLDMLGFRCTHILIMLLELI